MEATQIAIATDSGIKITKIIREDFLKESFLKVSFILQMKINIPKDKTGMVTYIVIGKKKWINWKINRLKAHPNQIGIAKDSCFEGLILSKKPAICPQP